MNEKKLAGQEKRRVAISSVIAAFFLTGSKFIVGVITGSLGIISEAVHSALDLVAAIVTVFAVHSSDIPPDKNHTYGHGKIENISALFETLLLLVTCFWIVYEALQRLFFKEVHIESSWWGFIVIVASIIIDFSRSRALMKAAKKYHSQALEADGLHFATDIWSSFVVLIGLGLVYLADLLKQPWLIKADAIAALMVAAIVIWVSIKLGKKTIDDLIDSIAPEMVEEISTIIISVPGVHNIKRLRVRRAGPEIFCDVVVSVHHKLSLEDAHNIAHDVEDYVRKIHPQADVIVHAEPDHET